jgi:phenylalanyl-tRNA synthetase beta chain
MKVPLDWLREYCDPPLDVAGIEERLTMTGTKVEAIHHHGVRAPERFVVGRVLTCERHPDADRLSVCEVDLGAASPDGPAKIVCGAPNVAAGQTVAVACVGAVMPDGMEIKRAKLRGVVSEGMICAERELEIDSSPPAQEGIMVLDGLLDEAMLAPGTPLAEALPIATEVVELEITPNRPDCLGVYGVARELHAATGAPLAAAPWSEDPGSEGPLAGARVEVECPDLCPRFTARLFENVVVAPSPPWLKARLSAAGQRPINNVVDITNYVMLLTGQPLHAFDLDRVAGAKLTVRRAKEGEEVETLDGQTRKLDGGMVVIDDGEGPTSIAGLMGGARSEVGEGTTKVLMEVASWDGPAIHRASWALGLRSEASARFEKGLDPEGCMQAQAVAARLMAELCSATVVPGTIDVFAGGGAVSEGQAGPSAGPIRLREARVEAILGVPVPRARQREILQALDFGTEEAPDGLDVTVPPQRRADVTREADLIEEVARIDGLERLPATLPPRRPAGMLTPAQRLRRRAVDTMVGCGLQETVGWTFTSAEALVRLRLPAEDPRRAGAVALENPLSEEQALLRTTLLGSLLDVAAHNAARGAVDLRLFEVGTVFSRLGGAASGSLRGEGSGAASDPPRGEDSGTVTGPPRRDAGTGVAEHTALAVLLSGRTVPPTWRTPDPPRADIYAVKGLHEALSEALRVPVECRPGSGPGSDEPFLHPGRAAEVIAGGEPIGWLGELHPSVSGWDLPGAAVMELDLDRLIACVSPREYVAPIDYPVVLRDLAVSLAEEIASADVVDAIRGTAGELLVGVGVFDVYTGAQAGAGKKSIALHLRFQAADRTLTDDEVNGLIDRILSHLLQTTGAVNRA